MLAPLSIYYIPTRHTPTQKDNNQKHYITPTPLKLSPQLHLNLRARAAFEFAELEHLR